MTRLSTAIATIFLCATALPAFAQAPQRVAQHNDWAAYSYSDGGTKKCYGASIPRTKEPASLNHGDIYFMIFANEGELIPQFYAGYNMSDDRPVRLQVGSDSYDMFVRENRAFIADTSELPNLIAAIKAGSNMTVRAVSGRGNETSYDFSLSGATATLADVTSCQ